MRGPRGVPVRTTGSDFPNHKAGSICRLTLENFMCTDNVCYNFNQNLNFLLGANGTGKSTIVCALYLLFDGNVKNLGRCPNLKEFINNERNNNDAKITVAIKKKDGGQFRIRRSWGSSSGTSVWEMRDGTGEWFKSNKSKLDTVMKEYNIQVENLFQFLPQEKVNEMNDMKPVDRLRAFEAAISDGQRNLSDKHEELIKFQEERKTMGVTLENQKQLLEDGMTKFQRDKGKIETYKKYKEYSTVLRYTSVQVIKTNFDQAIIERKEAEADYKDWEEQHKDVREKHLGKIQADLNILKKNFDKQGKILQLDPDYQNSQISKYIAELGKTMDTLISTSKFVGEQQQGIKNLEQSVIKTKREIKQKELEIKQHQDSYNRGQAEFEEKKVKWLADKNILEEEELKLMEQDIPSRRQKYEQKKTDLAEKVSQREDVKHRIKHAGNADSRRCQALTQSMLAGKGLENIIKAKKWIEENKHEFQADILMPAIFSIHAEDDAVKVLLDCCGSADLCTFITQSKQDNDLLIKKLRHQNISSISVAYMTGDELGLDKWKSGALDYKKFNFSHLLLNEIEGPDVVLSFLAKENRIHLIPWTNTQPKGDELNYILDMNKEERLTKYYVLGDIQQVTSRKRMQYSEVRELAENVASFIPKDNREYAPFSMRHNTEVISQLEEELRNVDKDRLEVENDMRSAKKMLEDAKKRENVLKKEISLLFLNINQKQGSKNEERKMYMGLAKLLGSLKDFPEIFLAKKKLQIVYTRKTIQLAHRYAELRDNLLKKCKIDPAEVIKLITLKKEIGDKQKELDAVNYTLIDQKAQGAKFKLDLQTRQSNETELREDYKAMAEDCCKCSVTECSKQLKSKFPQYNGKQKFASVEESRKYTRKTLQTLETEVQRLNTKLQALMVDEEITEHSVREHNDLEKKLGKFRKDLDSLENDIGNADNKSVELRERWLPVLKEEVKKVSEKLRANFKRIRCEGVIELKIPTDQDGTVNEEDYKNYGLIIKARYREGTDLQEVTTARHSGGERSVAAMLFLLSMPTKNCPFRLVDEINQGMDQYNERNVLKVVKELTEDSPVDDLCQFFIISPKLLLNLEYPRRSKVTIIHNMYPNFPRKANNTAKELERYIHNEEVDKEL